MPIFIKQKSVRLTLNSATNVNLANWIKNQGVSKGNIIVTIPAGAIIGGTVHGGYALNIGDIRAFTSVILNIDGEVQGKGGVPNGGHASHAIYSVYPLEINIGSTGAVRGGGGAGGVGKYVGGYRSFAWSTGYTFQLRYSHEGQGVRTGFGTDPEASAWWNNVMESINWDRSQSKTTTILYDGRDVYQRGQFANHNWHWHYIRKGRYTDVAAVAGSDGGFGEGYKQAKTNGGTAGNDGGNGGTWGAKGGTGQGQTTANGGNGGRAIYAANGTSTGIKVNNSGTIQGTKYY